MTPQDWSFVMTLVRETTIRAYQHGHEEAKAGKRPNPTQFALNRGHLLQLQKARSDFDKKR
jgi:hypothetical protein